MEGKVVFKGKTKEGLEVSIRYPQMSDLEKFLDYMNTISKEETFIRFQGEQISLEEEKKYLDGVLKDLKEKKMVGLLAFSEGNLIGAADVKMQDKIEKHIGLFGIIIGKDYRGKGLGTLLMDLTLKEAEKELPDLKIIKLGVFFDNEVARKMYKDFGFKEYGCLPEGIFYRQKFVDHIYMYKRV